ncbi:hypothetical protein BJ742DRAFT_872599 [Cladochytrium replicatum]|nr:hypothetical protein BJ742DRAFT_872599 [Cladochytrium replicatum]
MAQAKLPFKKVDPLLIDDFHHSIAGRPGLDDIEITGAFRVKRASRDFDAVAQIVTAGINQPTDRRSPYCRSYNDEGHQFQFSLKIPAQQALKIIPTIVAGSSFQVKVELQVFISNISVHAGKGQSAYLQQFGEKFAKDATYNYTALLTWPHFHYPHVWMIENRSTVSIEVGDLLVDLDFPPLLVPEREYHLQFRFRPASGRNVRQVAKKIQKFTVSILELSRANDTKNWAMDDGRSTVVRSQNVVDISKSDMLNSPAWTSVGDEQNRSTRPNFNPTGVFSTICIRHFLHLSIIPVAIRPIPVTKDVAISVAGFSQKYSSSLFDPPSPNATLPAEGDTNPNMSVSALSAEADTNLNSSSADATPPEYSNEPMNSTPFKCLICNVRALISVTSPDTINKNLIHAVQESVFPREEAHICMHQNFPSSLRILKQREIVSNRPSGAKCHLEYYSPTSFTGLSHAAIAFLCLFSLMLSGVLAVRSWSKKIFRMSAQIPIEPVEEILELLAEWANEKQTAFRAATYLRRHSVQKHVAAKLLNGSWKRAWSGGILPRSLPAANLSIKWDSLALDGASKEPAHSCPRMVEIEMGYVDDLEWWRSSSSELRYSRLAMDDASAGCSNRRPQFVKGQQTGTEVDRSGNGQKRAGTDSPSLFRPLDRSGQLVVGKVIQLAHIRFPLVQNMEMSVFTGVVQGGPRSHLIKPIRFPPLEYIDGKREWSGRCPRRWKSSGLEMKWSEHALDPASANGHLRVLEWRWTARARNFTSRYSIGGNRAGLSWHGARLRWTMRAGKKGGVLEWWKESELEMKWTDEALDCASGEGEVID